MIASADCRVWPQQSRTHMTSQMIHAPKTWFDRDKVSNFIHPDSSQWQPAHHPGVSKWDLMRSWQVQNESRVALAFPQRGLAGKAKCILISVHFSCGWNEPQPHRIAIQDAGILLNLQFVKPLKRCAGYPYYPLQKVQFSRHFNILNVYCPKNCCPQEAGLKWKMIGFKLFGVYVPAP